MPHKTSSALSTTMSHFVSSMRVLDTMRDDYKFNGPEAESLNKVVYNFVEYCRKYWPVSFMREAWVQIHVTNVDDEYVARALVEGVEYEAKSNLAVLAADTCRASIEYTESCKSSIEMQSILHFDIYYAEVKRVDTDFPGARYE